MKQRFLFGLKNNKEGIKMVNAELKLKDASAAAQRALLLEVLKKQGGATIMELQQEWGIIDPRPRVCELRWQYGLNIITHRDTIEDRFGNKRRVGRYVLLPGKWRGGRRVQ